MKDFAKIQGKGYLRKRKLQGKAIKEVGIFWPYILIPLHIITLKPLFFYLKTVITEFFLLQFKVKWGWKKISVVQVSDVIDTEIPFLPEKSDIYLDFILKQDFLSLFFTEFDARTVFADNDSALCRSEAYVNFSYVYVCTAVADCTKYTAPVCICTEHCSLEE